MNAVGLDRSSIRKTKVVFGLVVQLEMELNAYLACLVHDSVTASALSSAWISVPVMDSLVEHAEVVVVYRVILMVSGRTDFVVDQANL